MTVWEIIAIMVVGAICISVGIGMTYQLIVNAVEGYQVRRSKRNIEVLTRVIGELPKLTTDLLNKVKELQKKDEEEMEKFRKNFRRKFEDE